jgi:hypothetical protein
VKEKIYERERKTSMVAVARRFRYKVVYALSQIIDRPTHGHSVQVDERTTRTLRHKLKQRWRQNTRGVTE